jgi:hypothetical protein
MNSAITVFGNLGTAQPGGDERIERGPVFPLSLKHDPCERKPISRRRTVKMANLLAKPVRGGILGRSGSERSGYFGF